MDKSKKNMNRESEIQIFMLRNCPGRFQGFFLQPLYEKLKYITCKMCSKGQEKSFFFSVNHVDHAVQRFGPYAPDDLY